MEYLTQLNRFFELSEAECLPPSAQIVYLHLLNINNRLHWREWFKVANSTLERLTGMSNKPIVAAKNRLKQAGVLDFDSSGKTTTRYRIVAITTQDGTQVGTQDSTQDSTHGGTQVSTQDGTQDSTQLIRQDKTRKDKTKKTDAGGFAEFWSSYPRREKKAEAAKSYAKIDPDVQLQAVILRSLAAFKQTDQWRKDGGTYIPYASTWLNQRRWEDEIAVPSSPVMNVVEDITDEEYERMAAQYGVSTTV